MAPNQAQNEPADTLGSGFRIEPTTGDGRKKIALEQTGFESFSLQSSITYLGETGLELKADSPLNPFDKWMSKGFDEDTINHLRHVGPATLSSTDLASVPGPIRWWVNSYGRHTPAALIHDRFIGDPEPGDTGRPDGVGEQHIDRYFRFMLKASGEPFFKRWLMWSAVAARTQFHRGLRRSVLISLWIAAAVIGLALFVMAVRSQDWGALWIPLLAPLPAAALWGRQAGAGLIIAYIGVPVMLVPMIFAFVATVIYSLLEAIGQQISEIFGSDREPFFDSLIHDPEAPEV